MGTNGAGVAFKVNSEKFQLKKVVKELFGGSFEDHNGDFFDIRRPDSVFAVKTKDLIVLCNSGFAGEFFKSQETSTIKKYLDYFSNPDFVFAFEEYDASESYSYSLIYNGEVKRQLFNRNGKAIINFGSPERKELKWEYAVTYRLDKEEGGWLVYIDPEYGYTCHEPFLYQRKLQELMIEKLGFTNLDLGFGDATIEKGYFKKM
ncbi:hypothetical protein [Chitinophaga niabensis]|uniref:Uncharacterized protein n=1 Tax=Chitinophaga niabensis TaxID=536979 RepID=A0A1N6E8S9_9BACT|nr:hypothetical protein [Chitinophaga niabensis]SIN79413.1 hypothetical protein SAMN04488055_1392 [Chitinophaga niabensis]